MKRFLGKSAAAVLIAAALLTSCTVPFFPGDKEPEEKTTQVSFPLPDPLPEDAGEEREEKPVPSTEKGESAGALWVNGEEIDGGYRMIGGEKYAPLEGLLTALGVTRTETEEGARFLIGDTAFALYPALGGIYEEKHLAGTLYEERGRGLMAPLTLLTAAAGYDGMAVGDDLYYSETVKSEDVPKGIRVPVMMYHAVSDDTWGIKELFVKPAEMEKQLKYLTEHGYTTITFEDLPALESIPKPVMLTFDDGYRDNYEELFPLLKKYNCKATIFMIAGKEGKTHYLTSDMITEMSDSGLVSIQSHTMTHPKLGELSAEKQREELTEAQKTIVCRTHRIPFVLCYPSGSYNTSTREIGKEFYSFGIKMNGGLWNTSGDPFLVPRYYVSRETSLSAFAGMIG